MEVLFSSTTDQVLVLFLKHPKAQFYPNQIVHLTKKYPNSINQSLKRLVKLKLLKQQKIGSYFFYSLNRNSLFLKEIKNIFIKMNLLPVPKWRLVLDKILFHPDRKVTIKEKSREYSLETDNYKLNFTFSDLNGNQFQGGFELIEKKPS